MNKLNSWLEWLRIQVDGVEISVKPCGTCERCKVGNFKKCFSLPCTGCGNIGLCVCNLD